MPNDVDLVISFRASPNISLSKQQTLEDAQKAERQYSRLLDTLSYAGLKAVGRRGESLGHILIFVSCPGTHVTNLVKRERHSDFLHGLPTSRLPTDPVNLQAEPLAPSDRLRLIHTYIASTPAEGGLGISPDAPEWDLVESINALHDREFNDSWIRSWSKASISPAQFGKLRDQFGEGVALYFAFLWTYMRALVFPAVLGLLFYLFGSAYSPVYSCLLLVWATAFTEYWRVHERILASRFGTRGSFRVEKRRAQYKQGFTWWKREIRTVASIPVIITFAGLLATLLTGMFLFEAFVTQLYAGPGQKLVAFSPTILFILLVPRFLAVYQTFARRFTAWENHSHQSSYDSSLTIKTFVCSSLVAYLGLALSAFVYVPFGEGVMRIVQALLHGGLADLGTKAYLKEDFKIVNETTAKVWEADISNARSKLNPERLRDQMFAYTVTNQAVNTFLEVGLPFILRFIDKMRNGDKNGDSSNGKKKKVVFEDEKGQDGDAEIAFLERVRNELALPEYELFGDYSEMVTQYGYIALWSTIWPLAPVMALVNNFFELRSDAFKMTVHYRRPIPQRTDTIGPWLHALTALTWLSAVTNSALVYLFCPRTKCEANPGIFSSSRWSLFATATGETPIDRVQRTFFEQDNGERMELLLAAMLIAMCASHGYMFLRIVIRHIMERTFWKGSKEVEETEERERAVKEEFLRSMGINEKELDGKLPVDKDEVKGVFWQNDEGLEEIRRIVKEA